MVRKSFYFAALRLPLKNKTAPWAMPLAILRPHLDAHDSSRVTRHFFFTNSMTASSIC